MDNVIEPVTITTHPKIRKQFEKVLLIINRHKKRDENGNLVWESGQETFHVPEEEITPTLEAMRIVFILSSTYREVLPDESDDDDFCMFLLIAALSDWTNSDDDFAKGIEALFSVETLGNSRAKTLTYMLSAIAYCAQAIKAESDNFHVKSWKHLANAKYWSGVSLGTWEEVTQSKKKSRAFGKKGANERKDRKKIKEVRNYAIQLFMGRKYNSARHAASVLKPTVMEFSKSIGASLIEPNMQRLLADWFREHAREKNTSSP